MMHPHSCTHQRHTVDSLQERNVSSWLLTNNLEKNDNVYLKKKRKEKGKKK
jgi:hypothetical protein